VVGRQARGQHGPRPAGRRGAARRRLAGAPLLGARGPDAVADAICAALGRPPSGP
jgi:hypothetical protein